MIIEPQDISFHVIGNVICRNDKGEAVLTLTPREIVVLSDKKWIEGRARRGKKGSDGVRSVELMHVVAIVAMTKLLTLLKRRTAKQIKAGKLKAAGNYTWEKIGPTSFIPHFQRSAGYAGNAQRIGVVQA